MFRPLLVAMITTSAYGLAVRAVPVRSNATPVRASRLAMVETETNAGVPIDSADFANDELAGAWDRAGKGKPRWKPGDETGDVALDARLLYSSFILNPMVLYVSEGCTESMAAQLMLGWLKTPFKTVTSDEGALPRLDGKGVPSGSADGVASGPEDGLLSYAEIVSFCFAIAQNKALTVVPATGRADIAAWLAAPAADTFGPLLRGKQAGDNTPCLNSWGLSMDDAAVLPVLKGLVDAGADIDARVSEYLTENFAKAGIDV